MNTPKQTFSRVLQSDTGCGKMLPVRNGWLICPFCFRNRRVLRVHPKTVAKDAVAYCRDCKTEFFVDIEKGQCFESRSQ